MAMFNPRGNILPRPRGPNLHGPVSHGPFQKAGPGPGPRSGPGPGPRCGPGGLPRQFPPGPTHTVPQRIMVSDVSSGFPKTEVQVSQHRMDPRQAGGRMNMERQQKEAALNARWDNSFPQRDSSQPNPGRMAEHTSTAQSRYTSESASSILASFGLSNEDLEELSRYPDDQLTPENMPLILRDIQMRKMAHQLPSLPSQNREKETFCSDGGQGPMVKGKVIDYGHESKYLYADGPLAVKIFDSDRPAEVHTKGFQAQQAAAVPTAPPTETSKQMNTFEELIRQMGFHRTMPSTQSFFSVDTSSKGTGLCSPSAGGGVPPTTPPIISPAGPPPIPPPSIPPVVQQVLPPPLPAQHIMSHVNQLPPPFAPEVLGNPSRSDRIHHEPRANPAITHPGSTGGPKKYQKETASPIESPFGVVKASWLPVFSQTDTQKMKSLPTPSMMNDYYAASPRILPHMCTLCNVECRHMKDWIEHQNTSTHLESCRHLRQQYPDWNPESHYTSERRKGDRKENYSVRRRSASYSPKRSSPGRPRYRTRSRSRSPRYHRISRPRSRSRSRPRSRSRSRPRSRSPRRLPSPRRLYSPRWQPTLRRPPSPPYRPRSPWRSHDRNTYFSKSPSRERRSGKSRSPDKDLKPVEKRVRSHSAERSNKQRPSQGSSQESLGAKKPLPKTGKTPESGPKTSKSLPAPSAPSTKGAPAQHGPSGTKAKPLPEAPGAASKGGAAAEGKNKKPASGPSSAAGTKASVPTPLSRLLSSKAWSSGTVLHITNLPDDGYTQQDIKKLVQAFGKVNNVVMLSSKKEAYLEMSYKEAAIAAVKFSEMTPVLLNKNRVKITQAEKPQVVVTQRTEKKVQAVKKPPSSKMKEPAKPPAKPAKVASSATSASKSSDSKSAKGEKVVKSKSKAADPKKPAASKTATKAKKPADSKKPEERKTVPKSKTTTEPKKTEAEPKPPTEQPTAVPDTKEAGKSIETEESVIKEAEETCVVLVSNLPEVGISQDEIYNLAKPFGKVKDFLFISSHKKAYIEINCKSADSMVKFYTCFPMLMEMKQLCISLAPEFKDLNDLEAIFTAMINDASPSVNTEGLYKQFVHLGNLPDKGYSELEILCVGLRFGRVDHYMVINNKNKALLQLDSSESAASMCRFLKRYPYCLGESQLTFSRSPKIEPPPKQAKKKEAKKQEPSKESSDSKTIPEGSGVVTPSTVPSPEATAAPEDPGSSVKADLPEKKMEHSPEGKTEGDTEKATCEAAPTPAEMEISQEDLGIGAAGTVPSAPLDFPPPGEKPEGVPAAMPSVAEEEEKVADSPSVELLGNTSASAGDDSAKDEEAAPTGEPSGELPTRSEAEAGVDSAVDSVVDSAVVDSAAVDSAAVDSAADSAVVVEAEDAAAGALETAPQASAGPSGEEEASGDGVLPDDKRLPSEAEKSTEAPANVLGEPDAEAEETAEKEPKVSCSTTEQSVEVEPRAMAQKYQELAGEPELAAGAEGLPPEGVLTVDGGVRDEGPEENGSEEKPEQMLPPEAQPSQGPGHTEAHESCATGALVATPAPGARAASPTEAPVAAPPAMKTRAAARRKEAPKPSFEITTRSRAGAEKKLASKESSQDRCGSSKLDLPESSKSKLSPSPLAVELGSGKSLPPHSRDPQADTKGSLKQTRERENRSSSLKRDHSSTKVPVGRSSRSVRSSTKPEEEEELPPFNLDGFVTMDEVVDEADSPSLPRRNPVRGKRKDVAKKSPPHEPSSKRKKGRASTAHASMGETSFVTLDEIGEDEGGVPQVELAGSEAIPDAQGLVTVDEVNDEEELMEAIKDPQSLVTLDEISEQEDREPDLKAEPLVTVDEIGEIEELPLKEPSLFEEEEEESVKPQECETQVAEDLGDSFSSQVPEDPIALVTVDEDSDDQPLVTLDEVTEDDEDFLEDFNRLKDELNFVTVDEVGSEEEEEHEGKGGGENEEEDIAASPMVGEPLATEAQKEESAMPVAGEEEEEPSAESEGTGAPSGLPEKERVSMGDEPCDANEAPEAERGVRATEGDGQEAAVVDEAKDGGGLEEEASKADVGAQPSGEQLVTEPPGTCEGRAEADAPDMEVEKASESAACEEKEAGPGLPALSPDLPAGDSEAAASSQGPGVEGHELPLKSLEQRPEGSLESCGEAAAPSQSCGKPEKVEDTTESGCEEPESKRRKVDPADKAETSDDPKDLDFLVPKVGFFCQICSSFCVDEASMKIHCQSELHKQNKEKFMVKSSTQEEQKEVKDDAEEESST